MAWQLGSAGSRPWFSWLWPVIRGRTRSQRRAVGNGHWGESDHLHGGALCRISEAGDYVPDISGEKSLCWAGTGPLSSPGRAAERLCASGRWLSSASCGVDAPGTVGTPRHPRQPSGEQIPSLQSGGEDVCDLVLGPLRLEWGVRGKASSDSGFGPSLGAQPDLALLGGGRALSTLPLGIY